MGWRGHRARRVRVICGLAGLLAVGAAPPAPPAPTAPPAPDPADAPVAGKPLPDGAAIGWMIAHYGSEARYRYGGADLDGDGVDEALIYLGGPGHCGSGGCDLAVLKLAGDRFVELARTSVTRLPVGVLDTRSHGLRDLAVTVGGGGLAPGLRRLRFDGTRYPANPTVRPARATDTIGRVIIADGPLRPIVF